jgi:hypothetical protein
MITRAAEAFSLFSLAVYRLSLTLRLRSRGTSFAEFTRQRRAYYLKNLPDAERVRIGASARRRILSSHTSLQRGIELEQYVEQAAGRARAELLHAMPRPA